MSDSPLMMESMESLLPIPLLVFNFCCCLWRVLKSRQQSEVTHLIRLMQAKTGTKGSTVATIKQTNNSFDTWLPIKCDYNRIKEMSCLMIVSSFCKEVFFAVLWLLFVGNNENASKSNTSHFYSHKLWVFITCILSQTHIETVLQKIYDENVKCTYNNLIKIVCK